MEVYQERTWISEAPTLKRLSYERDKILPNQLIAEYCSDFAPTIAIVWVAYHSFEQIDLQAPHQYANDEDCSFAYVATNADELYRRYPDCWILVDKARVVQSASDPNELMRLASVLGINDPFITLTSLPELPGKAIYGGR